MFFGARKNIHQFLPLLTLIILSIVGQNFAQNLQYERSSILNGEYWRVFTCHFIHTGWNHLILNLAGSMLLYVLFFRLYSPLSWFIGAISCILSISLSLLFFYPTLEWYVGLSGLLHGFLIMGLIGGVSKGNRFYYLVLMAIVGKLVAEYFIAPVNHTEQFINASVVTEVHLTGAISGGGIAILMLLAKKIAPKGIKVDVTSAA